MWDDAVTCWIGYTVHPYLDTWTDIQKRCQNVCYKSVQIYRLWKQNGPKKASFALRAHHT